MSQRAERTAKVHRPEPQVTKSRRTDSLAIDGTSGPLAADKMAAQLRATLADMAGSDTAPVARRAAPIGAAAVVVLAKEELSRINGLEADRVSSVVNEPDGWHVTVELIELKRIPPSTDVIAAYDAVFAPDGALVSYHRSRRYLRDQMSEDL